MITFFLYWAIISLAGTLVALSLIWSGKRNGAVDVDIDSRQADQKSRLTQIKLRA